MKISISYPPLRSSNGIPLLSQNRQFQWFNHPTYIYPMVPAYAATLLKNAGFEVSWDDGIADDLSSSQYMDKMIKEQPNVIVLETKTPVIKIHWKIIDSLKQALPDAKIVLVGDHVTALPMESFENSMVDYVITGGDYDFLSLNLCKHLDSGETLEPGIWYREEGRICNTGEFRLNHDLNSLPFLDRDLTKWWLYSEKNGNYKERPGTYTLVGRDCWWHRCTFCSWTTLYPQFRVRHPESLLDEIGSLIENYGVKEVFDDTGTFPVGSWLEQFCEGMIDRGYNEKVRIGCNMKFGVLNQEQYNLMAKAGFRLLLFGLESANQETLNMLKKGINVQDIINGCRMAKQAGLSPHLTIMVGYPWETKKDALRTVKLAQDLFSKGWADTLQATIVIPYPGTPLFEKCKEQGLLVIDDWAEYDMKRPVMKTPMSQKDIMEITRHIYRIFFNPKYVVRRLTSIRSLDDLKFLKRGLDAISGHLKDFSK